MKAESIRWDFQYIFVSSLYTLHQNTEEEEENIVEFYIVIVAIIV